MAELRLERLSKVFAAKAAVHAVREFSLEVRSGECVALLGPSGAGKSTILRLVAGLEAPTGGEIVLDGRSLLHVVPGDRGVSMAFQNPALLPQLNVRENLALGLKLRKARNVDQRLSEVADLLAIRHLLQRKPETLSGGEQQRVALGRALAAGAKLLLLDEPLASLDPLARGELREVVRRVQRELGITTLYVTHDQTEASAVADRIAILRDGALEQFGPPREIYLNPATLFTARFFGADGLNTLAGNIVAGSSGWTFFNTGATKFRLSDSVHARTDRKLILGFRPSAVRLLPSDRATWQIIDRRELGWATVVRLQSGAQEICASSTGDSFFSTGQNIDVQIAPERLFLFDRDSGLRERL